MATIKDIARLAGVSHGTVSNVLNGRGNVSMKKILQVEEAAKQLGYSINDRGKQLRQEYDNSIGIVLPNITDSHYAILYTKLSELAQEQGISCLLMLTNDIPSQEESVLTELAGKRVRSILLVTCQPDGSDAQALLKQNGTCLVYLERDTNDSALFVGFNNEAIVDAVISQLPQPFHNLTVITGSLSHKNEQVFIDALTTRLPSANIQHLQTDTANALITAFSALDNPILSDAIITTNDLFATNYINACHYKKLRSLPKIISLSRTQFIPGSQDIKRIELDWKQMAIQGFQLATSSSSASRIVLDPRKAGKTIYQSAPSKIKINVMMLDGPDTRALQKLLPDFIEATNIDIQLVIFPYQELYNSINEMGNSGLYDVIRLDIVWLASLAEKLLTPFSIGDPTAEEILSPMLKEIRTPFSTVNNTIYAFPFTPTVQLLFYRKDLFDDPKIRRSYYETTHTSLSFPNKYESFIELARFFSRKENQNSPTDYGISVVQGTTSGITCEFLPILYSEGGRLFSPDGTPCIDSPEALHALEYYLEMGKHAYHVPSNEWWKGSVTQFTSGRSAMLNMFTNHVSGITNLRKSSIAGRIGYSTVPGGTPLLGGGVLGIAAASQKKEASLEFIRWACGTHISVPFTLLGGISPCSNVYTNEDLLGLYPWLSILPENYSQAIMRSVPSPLRENDVEHVLGAAIKNSIFNITTPDESLKIVQRQLETMLSIQSTK